MGTMGRRLGGGLVEGPPFGRIELNVWAGTTNNIMRGGGVQVCYGNSNNKKVKLDSCIRYNLCLIRLFFCYCYHSAPGPLLIHVNPDLDGGI